MIKLTGSCRYSLIISIVEYGTGYRTVSSYRVQVLVNLHNRVQVEAGSTILEEKKEAMTRRDRFNFVEKNENDEAGSGRQAS